MLDKTHAATNADVHEKVIQKLCVFQDFVMILGVLGPPGSSLEEGTEDDFKMLLPGHPFWDSILEHFDSQI